MKALKKYCTPQTKSLRIEEDNMICAGSMTIDSYDGGPNGSSSGETITGDESLSKENNASATWSVWGDED